MFVLKALILERISKPCDISEIKLTKRTFERFYSMVLNNRTNKTQHHLNNLYSSRVLWTNVNLLDLCNRKHRSFNPEFVVTKV